MLPFVMLLGVVTSSTLVVDNRLVSYVANWEPCPSTDLSADWTHVYIAFAVSYTWTSSGNDCSETCEVATPPICNSAENADLIKAWQNAGKKVILSFGGAGMGGTWDPSQPNCWEYCYSRTSSLVSQLVAVVESQGFDGIDIDYEDDCVTDEQLDFLGNLTMGLKVSLPEGQNIVTHVPRDIDMMPGQGYYERMKQVADYVDFINIQYYNGCVQEVTTGMQGKYGSYNVTPQQHFDDVVTGIFDGDASKVVWGMCISECSSFDVTADQAAQVMQDVHDIINPCTGGAFLWQDNEDTDGKWSSGINGVVSQYRGCSATTKATPKETTRPRRHTVTTLPPLPPLPKTPPPL